MRTRRRGANALEFALCLPAFVALLAGLVDFGWLVWHRAMADSALHFGCRTGAIVDPLHADPGAVAEEAILDSLADSGVACGGDCRVVASAVGAVPGRSLECTLERDFVPLFGFVTSPALFGTRTRIRLQWQRS